MHIVIFTFKFQAVSICCIVQNLWNLQISVGIGLITLYQSVEIHVFSEQLQTHSTFDVLTNLIEILLAQWLKPITTDENAIFRKYLLNRHGCPMREHAKNHEQRALF